MFRTTLARCDCMAALSLSLSPLLGLYLYRSLDVEELPSVTTRGAIFDRVEFTRMRRLGASVGGGFCMRPIVGRPRLPLSSMARNMIRVNGSTCTRAISYGRLRKKFRRRAVSILRDNNDTRIIFGGRNDNPRGFRGTENENAGRAHRRPMLSRIITSDRYQEK